MSINGTPLRRFGRYLVTQPRRGAHPFWRVCDVKTDEAILYSEYRGSADEGARRLATGRPLYTPAELLARSVARYATLYPSRTSYLDHVYLTNGNGLDWINGGLADTNVTDITPDGAAMVKWRDARRLAMERERLPSSVADEVDRKIASEGDTIRAQFAAGAWPDAIGETRLYPASDGDGAMHRLLTLDAPADEWVDDARAAMRLLLTHGRNSSERDETLNTLRAWADGFAARFGGQWRPDDATCEARLPLRDPDDAPHVGATITLDDMRRTIVDRTVAADGRSVTLWLSDAT